MRAREFARAHRVFKLWKNPNALTRCASTCSASFAKADAMHRWTSAHVPDSKIFAGIAQPNGVSGCPNFCRHGRRLPARIGHPRRRIRREFSGRCAQTTDAVQLIIWRPKLAWTFHFLLLVKIVVTARAKFFSRDESMHCDFAVMKSDTCGRRFCTRLRASRGDKSGASSRRGTNAVRDDGAGARRAFWPALNALDVNLR